MSECRIDGCHKARSAHRSLCSMHAARKKRHGDPSIVKRVLNDDPARFWGFIEREPVTGCWIWRGPVDSGGYGSFWSRGRRYADLALLLSTKAAP